MAYSVYAVAAAEFMAAFYERLFAGDTVSAAVTAGRQRLFRHPGRPSPKGDLPLADWVVPVHYLRREVRFPGLVTARPAGGPSLEEALDRLAGPGPGVGGALAPVGVFTGRDGLFYELETAARLQKVVILHGPAGTGKTELAKAFGRWWQDTGGVEQPEWVFWHSFEPGLASFGLDGGDHRDRPGRVRTRLRPAGRRAADRRGRGFPAGPAGAADLGQLRKRPLGPGPVPRPPRRWMRPDASSCAASCSKLAAGGRSAALITSRSEETWLDDGAAPGAHRAGKLRRIRVGGLAAQEATEYAGDLLAPYPAAAPRRASRAFGELMQWLDGHPLSMRLVLPHLDTTDPAGAAGGPAWDRAAARLGRRPGRPPDVPARQPRLFLCPPGPRAPAAAGRRLPVPRHRRRRRPGHLLHRRGVPQRFHGVTGQAWARCWMLRPGPGC